MIPSKLNRIDPTDLAYNPRANLSSWQRFQPLVEQAYETYPKPFIFTSTGWSPESIISKIRDAIRGKIAFDYPSKYTADEVITWWEKVIVRRIENKIYIGERIKDVKKINPDAVKTKYEFKTLEPIHLRCFALLLDAGLIEGPIIVHNYAHASTEQTKDLVNVEPIRQGTKLTLI